MAQLSKVRNSKPLPIGIDSVYIKNLPAKRMQELFGSIETRITQDPEVVIVELFNELICDENGDVFDDVATYDDIMGAVSIKDIHEIMNGIATTVNPTANDLGK